LEAEEEESPLEEDEEKVSWEPLSMSSLPLLSSSPLSMSPSMSPLSLPPKMASSTVLTSKDEEYLQPPPLLWKCGCNVWVSVVVENTKVCHEAVLENQ
jgi:hypothetical protein